MKYLNLYSIRFFCLFISLFLLNFLPSEAFSQTPLDIQVLNNRIDTFESKVQKLDSSTVTKATGNLKAMGSSFGDGIVASFQPVLLAPGAPAF